MQIVVDHENGQVYCVWAAKLGSYLEHHQISTMKRSAKTINDI